MSIHAPILPHPIVRDDKSQVERMSSWAKYIESRAKKTKGSQKHKKSPRPLRHKRQLEVVDDTIDYREVDKHRQHLAGEEGDQPRDVDPADLL
jgi:hypothetical protein